MGDAPSKYAATVGSGTLPRADACSPRSEAPQGDAAGAEELYRRSLDEHPEYVAPGAAAGGDRSPAARAPLAEIAAGRPRPARAPRSCSRPRSTRPAGPRTPSMVPRTCSTRSPRTRAARIGLAEALLSQRRYADAAAEAALRARGLAARTAPRSRCRLFAARRRRRPRGDRPHRLGRRVRRRAGARGRSSSAPGPTAIRGDAPPHVAARSGRPPSPDRPRGAAPRRGGRRVRGAPAASSARSPPTRASGTSTLARIYFRRGFLGSAADEWIEVAETAPDAGPWSASRRSPSRRASPTTPAASPPRRVALEPGNPTRGRPPRVA